jgi:hypothetical protein
MGPFSVLSIIGEIWPRVVAIGFAVGFVFFRHDATTAFMWAVHVEAAHFKSIFEHAVRASLHPDCHIRIAGCSR